MLSTKLNDEPKMIASHRNLIGEGSHRRLVTSITLEFEPSVHSFAVVVIERLPSGVFADPFELQRLVLRGVLKDAAVFGDTNLELPSFRSNRSLVEVHVGISPELHSGVHFQKEVKIELPLHARYQPLGHGFSVVEFGKPDVLLRYRVEENLLNRSCLVVPTNQSVQSEDGRIDWEVPCGNKEHTQIVAVVTFASAVLSAFLIILTSVSYSNFAIASDLKQS
ncbi:OLC1v1029942C1 [Oldenlandia corymbosa var. corymbosa]|nr:OLC1v1029942C1 [Oldenlandia corymbosa var. corymbosa]